MVSPISSSSFLKLRKIMKKIILYGLQRSGTNYLETLLLNNFKVDFANQNHSRISKKHKHFRFYSNKLNSYCSSEVNMNSYFHEKETNDFSFLSEDVEHYFFIYKEPVHWLVSFDKFLHTFPTVTKDNIDKKYPFEKRVRDYDLYIQHINQMQRNYKKMRVYSYEDLILNTENYLNELVDIGYERTNSNFKVNFNQVEMSHYTFDQKKIDYIKNKEYENLLTEEQLAYVRDNIT